MIAATRASAALFPVSVVLEEIDQRLRRLNIEVSLEMLRRHVRRLYLTADPEQAADFPYFQTYLAKCSAASSPAARCHSDFLNWGLNVLEMALLSCEQAMAPEPKPLRALLLEGLDLCRQFDLLEALYHDDLRSCVAARALGGKARQAKLEPARRRAARLLLAKAPEGGWESPAHAARTIEPHVAAFVARRHLSMWGSRRTIVKWINHHSAVRSAYNKRRRPPAP